MDQLSLSASLADSITKESSNMISDFAEIALDSVLEDGLLKDIPFVSTAISLYRIGKSIHEREHIRKLAAFLDEIRQHALDEAAREEYLRKLRNNPKMRDKELEYALVIIDRYIGYDKPRMLAKLYLAFLQEEIDWNEFAAFSEVIDRLLPNDYQALLGISYNCIIRDGIGSEPYLRLAALGMIYEQGGDPPYATYGQGDNACYLFNSATIGRAFRNERAYKRTDFGNKFIEIIEGKGK